jgi:uncharacterized protein YndB with AHSA1/START domain
MRTESRSITIAAPAATVFDFVADARNLPVWAPAFASAVRPDGDRWIVTSDAGEVPIRVRASAEHGTVDLVSAADRDQGAFSRVLPNGDGAEYQFTLFFPDGTDEAAVERQMRTVEEELEAVRAGCECTRSQG